jgi:hypothetical protein
VLIPNAVLFKRFRTLNANIIVTAKFFGHSVPHDWLRLPYDLISLHATKYSGDTTVNKPDGSYTVYPKEGTGNTFTVYPPAADGTQKTVTVTSEGQPVVTVRDANGNVIPPKE